MPTCARWRATSSRASPTSRRSCTASAVDRVAFHEVGAYDSIADVVGVAAAIAHLAPASIGSLPPVVGTGRVRTAHGPVPVPAPATAALLSQANPDAARRRGRADDADRRRDPGRARRRLRPAAAHAHGAPSVTAQAPRAARSPERAARRRRASCWALPDAAASPQVVLLEANIDDMSPQLVAPLADALPTQARSTCGRRRS